MLSHHGKAIIYPANSLLHPQFKHKTIAY